MRIVITSELVRFAVVHGCRRAPQGAFLVISYNDQNFITRQKLQEASQRAPAPFPRIDNETAPVTKPGRMPEFGA